MGETKKNRTPKFRFLLLRSVVSAQLSSSVNKYAGKYCGFSWVIGVFTRQHRNWTLEGHSSINLCNLRLLSLSLSLASKFILCELYKSEVFFFFVGEKSKLHVFHINS